MQHNTKLNIEYMQHNTKLNIEYIQHNTQLKYRIYATQY